MSYPERVKITSPANGSTSGTKVLLPNGTAIPMVTSIHLRAVPNDLWRATIECCVTPESVTALADVLRQPTEQLLERFKGSVDSAVLPEFSTVQAIEVISALLQAAESLSPKAAPEETA